MKIKAAILTQLKAPLEIWELEMPPLKSGQVLVKMAYSGLCHSQINEIEGFKGEDPYLPHMLGHEGSGLVERIGPDVTKVKLGERVVLTWLRGGGAEVPSTRYNATRGNVNSGAISTFANYAIISENRVVPIPSTMPLREAALLGCALPTGAGVVFHEMGIKKGNSFALFGAGGVGLSALLAAKMAEANPIIAVDVQEHKLEKAKQLGATHLVHALKTDPARVIYEITEGERSRLCVRIGGEKRGNGERFRCVKSTRIVCFRR